MPQATKVGLLINPSFPNSEPEAAAASDAARLFGLTPILERVATEGEFEPAFARFEQGGVNVILVIATIFFVSHRDRLAALALRHGIPMFGQSRNDPIGGALASYGTNYPDVVHQAGT
jgi:ABC-type uncharacterized transport system substrate-binding protein